jgi:hypothetical protein
MADPKLGEKAIACLRIAQHRPMSPERKRLYDEAVTRYSENAVCAKMEELADRGYLDWGVSPRMGWLTEKGRKALGLPEGKP